jgi:phosphatidylserine/phosphatidylglycerophosphate/cardiolipin synthase-like enzyme
MTRPSSAILFGGPDRPARALRDELEERIEAVPAGGAIDWITYYFRDEGLAEALVRARRRGVAVTVSVDGDPRHARANDRVIAMLSSEQGLGSGLHIARYWLPGHLHTKLYCFSHPRPAALVGSFNPSGNQPEHDPEVIADIGDQDRGHNLLVEIAEPGLVQAFRDYAARIHRGANRFASLVLSAHVAEAGQQHVFFFPRFGRNPLQQRLAALGTDARLRIAASHFGDRRIADQLAALVARGAEVDVLTHHTQRRSPSELVQFLRNEGVRTYRYEHPEELPMHAKFIIAEDGPDRWSAFGSYNLNRTSRWANEELLVFSEDEALWQALSGRWATIVSEPWCKA